MDYTMYIRNRITELRLQKDVSEYQMSFALGQNKNYIQSISSGKAMPSMKQFLNICEYFDMTPMQFFDDRVKYPKLIQEALEEMNGLSEEDLMTLILSDEKTAADRLSLNLFGMAPICLGNLAVRFLGCLCL